MTLLSQNRIKDPVLLLWINRNIFVYYYHPLLKKEKELETLVRKILPKSIADALRPKGSRLAHLYGLPKTHKQQLAVRSILSATNTYNYMLGKWLDDKLKPFSCKQYTVMGTFRFADEVRGHEINNGEIWFPMTSPLYLQTYNWRKQYRS